MAVTTATAILLGSMAIGAAGGLAEGISNKKQANANIAMFNEQAEYSASERLRQANKLQQHQSVSYLKSGVLLSGTPEIVMQETATFANEDVRQIFRQRDVQSKNLSNAANMGMFTSLLKGTIQGASFGYSASGGSGYGMSTPKI